MKIIFKEQNGKLFGETEMIGIGKKQPKLIYGEQAKKLREKANLTIDDLSKEFGIRPNIISKIEQQQASLDEKTMNKYIDKFGVNKEYFFDLDLETLILSVSGNILKSYDTSEECLKEFNYIMDEYFKYLLNEGNNNVAYLDFSKPILKGGK